MKEHVHTYFGFYFFQIKIRSKLRVIYSARKSLMRSFMPKFLTTAEGMLHDDRKSVRISKEIKRYEHVTGM